MPMISDIFLLLLGVAVTALVSEWVSGKRAYAMIQRCFPSAPDTEKMIYQARMAEIHAAQKQGLLDAAGADEARRELARRLLAGEKGMATATGRNSRTALFCFFLVVSVLFIPFFSWSIYTLNGSSGMPSRPFSSLVARDPAMLDEAERLVRAEVMASRRPQDGRLADELADFYLDAGRFQDAVNAYSRAIALNGESVRRLTRYAMALTGFEAGMISQEAERALRQAARLDPRSPDASLFLARGLVQNGKRKEAVKLLEDFLRTAPEDVSWKKYLSGIVAGLKKPALPASAGQDAALTPQQRSIIAANVDRLATRLAARPDDLQGWMMLVRARLILKQFDAARVALANGLAALPASEAEKLAAFAREKGFVSPGGRIENTAE